jgi:predicted transposase YbfD/YdcC/cell division septation protein DedD
MDDPRSILAHFGVMIDPRVDRTKEHKLVDILVIALCAVICGAEHFTEMEEFGQAKEEWFRTFLELPNGIPSHDTFGRVLSMLDPAQFQACFLNWAREIAQLKLGEVIAIDGKSLNGSIDTWSGKTASKIISAWATDAGLVIGQTHVPAGTNETAMVPELLKVLMLKGCIVTVDAANSQTKNAQLIVERGGDYVMALKENQGRLYADVEQAFRQEAESGFRQVSHSVVETQGRPGSSVARVGLVIGGIVLGAVAIFALGVMEGSRVAELAPVVAAPPNALPTETLATLPSAPVTPITSIPTDKLTFYDRLSGVAPPAPLAAPEGPPPVQQLAPATPAGREPPAPQPEAAPAPGATAAAPKKTAAPVVAASAAKPAAPAKTDPAAQIRKLSGKGRYTVQMAAVSDRATAAETAAQVKRNGFDAVTVMASVKGKIFYRVRVGSFPSKQAASQAAGIFRSAYGLAAIPVEN